ncbi:hypothetical protein PYW08_003680 [Mythimna loreyi]|uniref:Uncharacterized protein n=1 Tax=Mythimna loreyi TaxID=667449 RepID=A0ACC2QVK4_9NEOP|nr:hypothetical protein PYW08_003680 [Mythimna loreyi]
MIVNEKYNKILKNLHSLGRNLLILYLAATDIVEILKKKTIQPEKWYVDLYAYTVYKRFLESKIKRRYQEKNEIDILNPDIITAMKKELTSSISKHKKIYVIFNGCDEILFSEKDLQDIKEMINVVKKGEEKTGLINSVENGIPIFVHKSFTEYFAVEYVCNCLKNQNIFDKTIYFNTIFSKSYFKNILKILESKIKIDDTLKTALENNKDVIFNCIKSVIMKNNSLTVLWSLIEDLKSLKYIFLKAIEYGLNSTKLTNTEKNELLKYFSKRSYLQNSLTKHALDKASFIF